MGNRFDGASAAAATLEASPAFARSVQKLTEGVLKRSRKTAERTDDDPAALQALASVERAGKPAKAAEAGVVLLRGSEIQPEPISWLWEGWLALGKLHLLAGAPGQGKTTIALAAVATVTTGGRWPDGSRCAAGNVLIWSGEDDFADTLLPRLIAMGADRERVYFVSGTRLGDEVLPFDPARDMAMLTAAAERIGDMRLMVVDPIVSAVAGDSHKNTEVRRAMQPLVDLASSMQAAILGITHLSKGTAGRDPTERVTGSIAFTAVVRLVWLAAKAKTEDGEDRRILVRAKSNIGPDEGGFEYGIDQLEALPGITASRVTWGKAIEGTARELLAEADTDTAEAPASSTDEAVEALKRILSGDVVPSKEATEAMKREGFTDKVIRRARERIGVIVKREGFGKDMKSYWKLPAGASLPTDEDEPDTQSRPSGPIRDHSRPQKERAAMGTTDSNGHDCDAEEGF